MSTFLQLTRHSKLLVLAMSEPRAKYLPSVMYPTCAPVFQAILQHRDEEAQLLTLRVLLACVKSSSDFPPSELSHLTQRMLPLVMSLTSQGSFSLRCRLVVCELIITLSSRQQKSLEEKEGPLLSQTLRSALTTLLLDESVELRTKILGNFLRFY
jgi:hypothetical protein